MPSARPWLSGLRARVLPERRGLTARQIIVKTKETAVERRPGLGCERLRSAWTACGPCWWFIAPLLAIGAPIAMVFAIPQTGSIFVTRSSVKSVFGVV